MKIKVNGKMKEIEMMPMPGIEKVGDFYKPKKTCTWMLTVKTDDWEVKVKKRFTLIPPKEGEPHYGNGYYMRVEAFKDGADELIDCRYLKGRPDVEAWADLWVDSRYGDRCIDMEEV